MRFRKSIKLFPGVRFNLSKSGVSTSIGVKSATINIEPGRSTRATAGIAGTGLSQTTNLDGNADTERSARSGPSLTFVVIVILLVLFGVYGVMHWRENRKQRMNTTFASAPADTL